MGDAGRGKRIFLRHCARCHSLKKGDEHKYGPNLYGLFGRKAGRAPDYEYSEANKNADIIWTKETLFEYLKNPREYIPGTKKNVCGLSGEEDRINLITYLDRIIR